MRIWVSDIQCVFNSEQSIKNILNREYKEYTEQNIKNILCREYTENLKAD